MPDVTRRRHLVQQDKDDFDCCLTFDVNEYLIDNYPTLTFRNRQSVWSICQNNDDFDWDVVEDQIIDCIYELAETDSSVVLPDEEDEDEDDEDATYDDVIQSVATYIESYYDDMEEESEDFASFVIDKLDDLLTEYYDSDDEEEETTES